ncbi:YlbF family regulator [Baia soyae]|nr:YlbF family regulator [Baia soyae]
MNNPYDFAHGLARSLRESDVFVEMKKLKSEIESNESYKEMLKGYHQLHIEMQTVRMQGIEPTDEFKERAEKTTLAIQGIPVIMQYLQAEERLSILLNDIQKIMLEPVQEIMDFS